MQDLDSYQLFCAALLLESKQRKNSVANQSYTYEEDVVCACANYLKETL